MRRTNLKDAGRDWHLVMIHLVTLVLSYLCFLEISHAQVASPITSSGLNTVVTTNGTLHNITGGTRPNEGFNLFHSFGEFGVPANNIASFLNETALPTNNILGRVTGSSPSNIFGSIQTTGFGNANLFLMNPAGFLFGPNATVNVGGLVSFTSADYLKLTDNARFNAIPTATADALLTSSPVTSFGFLGSNPGAIMVKGSQFTLTEGLGISLVGGNIEISSGTLADGTVQPAHLSAPGEQINLVSVGSAGEVLLQHLLPEAGITMGTITLSQGSTLDVSADAAGTIRVRGGQFVIDNATISADTINAKGAPVAIDISLTGDLLISAAAVPALTAMTTGSGDAGEIRISSQNMDVTATGFGDFTPFPVIDTHTSASGKAGAVSITTTDDLTVTGDPTDFVFALDSGTTGPDGGQGGSVTLNAKNMDIQYAAINTGDFVANNLGEEAVGSGGNITIMADSLKMTQSSVATDGFFGGRGGNLTISAHNVQLTEASVLSTTGNVRSGTIQLNVDHLMVNDSQLEANTGAESGGGIIFTGKVGEFKNGSTIQSSTFGSGTAGKINFTGTDRLTFSDDTSAASADIRPTGLFTTAVRGTGNAADIIVTTPLLEITGGARFDATTRTSGDGGRITITADVVSISGQRTVPIFEGPLFGLAESPSSGIFSRTIGTASNSGAGGNIALTASQSVTISDSASVSANSTGAGNAGNIFINAGQQFEMRDSSVTTQATQASGGNINILAVDRVRLVNSVVSSSVQGDASTAGGNITIDPNVVVLQNSQVIAQAVQGAGGNITIFTPLFLADSTSLVSASSQKGINGTVTIQSPTSNLSESLGTLPSEPSQAQALLTQRCAALVNGQASSFVVAGREQLPADPGGWLSSPLAFAALGEILDAGHAVASAPTIMAMATQDTSTLSLRRLTPTGFLMANFADSAATGCHS